MPKTKPLSLPSKFSKKRKLDDTAHAEEPQLSPKPEEDDDESRTAPAEDSANNSETKSPLTSPQTASTKPSPQTASSKVSPEEESGDFALTKSSGSILSDVRFSALDVSEPIKKALATMEIDRMTQIQKSVIPAFLEGRDILASAKTGSGKTLAFVVPALDLLYRSKVTQRLGTVALVLAPTRELAIQIGEVVREAGQFLSHTFGTIIGGAKKKTEAEKLVKGVNFLVATPGRLLDHMQTTPNFLYKNLLILIMDEADRMLEVGFEKELNQILSMLPKKRQTGLFSATQTNKVADLARMSLKKSAHVVVVQDTQATVQGLTQGYIICSADLRLALLFKLLKRKLALKEKVMVFFSSCASVQYHEDLFNYLDLKCTAMHGKKKQAVRNSVYNQYLTSESGILLCTSVAARGLDFPNVDLIVQFDPPDDVKEYIHRVGRTARGENGKGDALLFLMPEENGFLKALSEAKVSAKEFAAKISDLGKITALIKKVVEKNYHLAVGARNAYKGFMLAYNSHAQKDIFDLKRLDIVQVAKSFGLSIPPRVEVHTNPLRPGSRRRKTRQ